MSKYLRLGFFSEKPGQSVSSCLEDAWTPYVLGPTQTSVLAGFVCNCLSVCGLQDSCIPHSHEKAQGKAHEKAQGKAQGVRVAGVSDALAIGEAELCSGNTK